MNKFKESLKVNLIKGKKYILDKLEEIVTQELKKVTDDKELSLEERIEQSDVLINTYKILEEYDNLEPVLIKYFAERKRINRQKQNETWDSISK